MHDDIYVMNADGTNQVQLTEDLGYDNNPSWSPDGSQIVYAHTNHDFCCHNPMAGCPCRLGAVYTLIYVMNADGSNEHALTERVTLTENSSHTDTLPAWAPDNSKIIFVRNLSFYFSEGEGGGNNALYTMNPDGSGLALFDDNDPSANTEPAWSPDAAKVVYANGYDPFSETPGREIFVSNSRGPKQTVQLTNNSADDTKPAWQSR
jgi:Tol biopolymer transport system component